MKKDLISLLSYEAKNYDRLEDIEKLVESGKSFKGLPLGPLYYCFSQSKNELRSEYLPQLEKKQRSLLLDIDLWQKDEIDPDAFDDWVCSYFNVKDEKVKFEFVSSDQFLLYLKSRFNIYTFDVEDPQYPDHDYYFLTDDSLLLFEYHKDYAYVDEVKGLIRELYGELGVEKAYVTLFKLVSETYSVFHEEQYQEKKHRLNDYGMVDYFKALELTNCYPSLPAMKKELEQKFKQTPVDVVVDNEMAAQALHTSELKAFENGLELIQEELTKVEDQARINFLRFNFIRLTNASYVFHGSHKKGRMAMVQTGKLTKNLFLLAFDYLKENNFLTDENCAFTKLDFFEVYKIANTLVNTSQKRLKKAMFKIDAKDYKDAQFVGQYFAQYLADSFLLTPSYFEIEERQTEEINNLKTWSSWDAVSKLFLELSEYTKNLRVAFAEHIEKNGIQSSYYLNYELEEIDFETIFLTQFCLNELNLIVDNKWSLTTTEYRTVMKQLCRSTAPTELIAKEEILLKLKAFASKIGFILKSDCFDTYLYSIVKESLEGYDLDELSDKELSHVGGPIILYFEGVS